MRWVGKKGFGGTRNISISVCCAGRLASNTWVDSCGVAVCSGVLGSIYRHRLFAAQTASTSDTGNKTSGAVPKPSPKTQNVTPEALVPAAPVAAPKSEIKAADPPASQARMHSYFDEDDFNPVMSD